MLQKTKAEVEAKAEEPKSEEVVQIVIELIGSVKDEQERVKVQLARLRALDRSFSKLKADFGKRYNGLASTLEKKTRRKAQSDSKPRAKSGFSKPAPMSQSTPHHCLCSNCNLRPVAPVTNCFVDWCHECDASLWATRPPIDRK